MQDVFPTAAALKTWLFSQGGIFRGCIFFALVFYTITAINSKGYHQADEHYQIVEFALYKQGAIKASDLAWEFERGMRSAVQPAIAYLVMQAAVLFSIDNPHTIALLLRLLSAVYAVWAISRFVKAYAHFVLPSFRHLFVLLSFFFWLLPYWNVRFSSETWSGLTFILALSCLESALRNATCKQWLLTGVLAGVSILFRFQVAVMVVTVFVWLLTVQRLKFTPVFFLLTGTLAALCIGTLVDFWFYGRWVLTALNYFKVNIVEDIASAYGTEPFYYYVVNTVRLFIYPIGWVFCFCFLYLILKHPLHLLTLLILSFVVVHSLIPHKEMRFLVPLINLLPLITIMGLQEVATLGLFKKKGLRLALLGFGGLLVMLNATGFFYVATTSAGDGRVALIEHIQNEYPSKELNIIHTENAYPHMQWEGLPAHFYQTQAINNYQMTSLCVLDSTMLDPHRTNLVVVKLSDLGNLFCNERIQQLGFVEKKQSIPEWSQALAMLYDRSLITESLVLYGPE